MATKTYENGRECSKLDDKENGFIYYPSGLVAVCISEASSYQKRFFAFDSNRKNTNLLIIDEFGVGFCSVTQRKSFRGKSCDLSLSKLGGIISDSDGHISQEWKWDPNAQDAGSPPVSEQKFQLNENITFTFNTSRADMKLLFQCEGFVRELDLGAKVKRQDSYLDHAQKGLAGKLIPQFEHTTLSQRQDRFAREMAAQRNKVNPRSENLSAMVRDIVNKLECDFDNIRDDMKSSQSLGMSWKKEAMEKTISEIPRVLSTGQETGLSPGLSTTIYRAINDVLESTIPARLLDDSGKWKGSVEIRNTLKKENPPLPRSAMLSTSGRYSSLLVVDKSSVSSTNPTGMVEVQGIPLHNHHWAELKSQLSASPSSSAPLTVALVLRGGDPVGQQWLRLCEIVNEEFQLLAEAPGRPESAVKTNPPHIIKIDVSESNSIMSELGIKSIPTFLMFHGKSLVYAGPVGGKKSKLTATPRPQVLLIEPNFRQQMPAERLLRKMGCDTFLCMNVSEAVSRISQLSKPLGESSGQSKDSVIFDLVLISEDLTDDSVIQLKKLLLENIASKRTIVAMLVNILGEHGKSNVNAVKWNHSFTDDVQAFNNPMLTSLCVAAIQNPIKVNAVEKLLQMIIIPDNDTNFGITENAIKQKIAKVQEDIKSGRGTPISYVGIRMCAEDTVMRGKSLVSSKK